MFAHGAYLTPELLYILQIQCLWSGYCFRTSRLKYKLNTFPMWPKKKIFVQRCKWSVQYYFYWCYSNSQYFLSCLEHYKTQFVCVCGGAPPFFHQLLQWLQSLYSESYVQWRIEACLCFLCAVCLQTGPFNIGSPPLNTYNQQLWLTCVMQAEHSNSTTTWSANNDLLTATLLNGDTCTLLVLTLCFFFTICFSRRLQANIWDQCWAEGSSARCHRGADQQNAPEITKVTLRNSKLDKTLLPFLSPCLILTTQLGFICILKNRGYIKAKGKGSVLTLAIRFSNSRNVMRSSCYI